MSKMLVLGVKRQSGTGKESQKPYELAPEVYVATPIEKVSNATLRIEGAGFEASALRCSPEVFAQLAGIAAKLPMVLDVSIEPRKGRMAVEPFVVAVA